MGINNIIIAGWNYKFNVGKEFSIGNKEITLKKYTPTPFISMPIAQ